MERYAKATGILTLLCAALFLWGCDQSPMAPETLKQQTQAFEQQTLGDEAHAGELSAEEVRRHLEKARESAPRGELPQDEAARRDSLLAAALQNVEDYDKNATDVEYFYGDEALVKMGILTEEEAADTRPIPHSVLLQRLFDRAAQKGIPMTRYQAVKTGDGVEINRICAPHEDPPGCEEPPPPPPPPDDPPGDDPPDDDPPPGDDPPPVTYGGSSYATLRYNSFFNDFTAEYSGNTWSSEPFDRLAVQTVGLFNNRVVGGYGYEAFNTWSVSAWFKARFLEPDQYSRWNHATASSGHVVENIFSSGYRLYHSFGTRYTATYFL